MCFLQVVQGCRLGPPLGGQGLVKWCRLASVLAGFPQSPGGRPHAELTDPSRLGASPQHQQEVPPGQPAAGHRAAALAQLWQGGQWLFAPTPTEDTADWLVCLCVCLVALLFWQCFSLFRAFCNTKNSFCLWCLFVKIFYPQPSWPYICTDAFFAVLLSYFHPPKMYGISSNWVGFFFVGSAGSSGSVWAPKRGSTGVDVSSGH